MFEPPKDWQKKYDEVVIKTEAYIITNYWEGIDIYTLKLWLQNFKSDEEKYLSGCMLDALVFRSKDMISSSFKHLSSSLIPKFLNSKGISLPNSLDDWLKALRKGTTVPFRFIAIETIKDKPGKSGSVVVRDISSELDLAAHLIKSPNKIPEITPEVKALILIDDFAGTGQQFCDFYEQKIKPHINKKKYHIAYCPLACHSDALRKIKDLYPEISVIPVELLTEKDSFFFTTGGFFREDQKNTVEDAKNFYLNLCKSKGLDTTSDNSDLFGKGEQALSFGFYFSTPNNNLKLYYARPANDSWHHLLTRRK